MVDNYQPYFGWSVDVHSRLIHGLASSRMAVGRCCCSCPAFGCIILSRVEDVEHVVNWHDEAFGFGFSDQLLQLDRLLVGRVFATPAATLTWFGPSRHVYYSLLT